jgi:hypothetical protein
MTGVTVVGVREHLVAVEGIRRQGLPSFLTGMVCRGRAGGAIPPAHLRIETA